MPKSTLGPFATGTFDGREVGEVSAEGRINKVRRFTREQCHQALQMPDLQATVRRAVERRLRQLDREG